MSPAAEHLVARTEQLDLDVDLVQLAGGDGLLYEHHGQGLAGIGEALRIDLSTSNDRARLVHDELGAIESTDSVRLPGTGAIAFGSLPFEVDAPANLVVPEVIVGKAPDGNRWLTVIAPASAIDEAMHTARQRIASLGATTTADPATEASSFEISPTVAPDEWCASVAQVRDHIRAGKARKVVLAREVVVRSDEKIDVATVLARLRAMFAGCTVFSIDGFVGASPELLVARVGDLVRSHPLAGTAPRSTDADTDAALAAALLASSKDLEEHRITIDMVHDTLLPFCSYLDEEAEPSIVSVANVQHLGTMVEGRLSSPPASVMELLAVLHPTPAVCGDPRDVALEMIGEHEPVSRGRYAGPVGWVDAAGNGEWAVAIRSAEIDGRTARLFAGVGVVADSDPAAELAETRAKFQALLAAIVRP